MSDDRPLIIYHGGCPDGFTSAWLIHRWLLDREDADAELYPAAYNEAPPDVNDRRVWCVDFCYEPQHVNRMTFDVRQLVILDHHQTAAEWLDQSAVAVASTVPEMVRSTDSLVVLDEAHSGAGLAKLYTDTNDAFVDCIEDRDLWRFHIPETKDIFAAVTARPYTLPEWDLIASTPYGDLVREGKGINRYRDRLIEQVAETAYIADVCGKWMPLVGCPYAIGSDVAGRLAEESPDGVAAYYVDYGTHRRYGLRSTPDGPDVAKLAEPLGGGGHKHAAGFEVTS